MVGYVCNLPSKTYQELSKNGKVRVGLTNVIFVVDIYGSSCLNMLNVIYSLQGLSWCEAFAISLKNQLGVVKKR